ncbi:DUF5994 family protein [Kitasatospora sp. NPDC091276]|uniref:DUF5994 family protein n=1 Tax=Kitasatospora sp. NPDC091276 TaxID=3155300 RepID=UPI00344420CB
MTATSEPGGARVSHPEPPARLSLVPEGVAPGRLGGAWWPRSRDLLRELPPLAATLAPSWGEVLRVTVNPAHWPVIPRRVPVTGHVIHVGWFEQEQDAEEVVVCSFVPRRLDLLVIPPETEAPTAEWLMTAVCEPANTRTATELLAAAGAPTEGARTGR